MSSALLQLRRRRYRLALLVLPALLFRAAIPVGFMPIVDVRGGLSIEFCPGDSAEPAVAGLNDLHAAHARHAMHASHAMHAHQHGVPDPASPGPHHVPCLFAASAGGAPAPAAIELIIPPAAASPIEVDQFGQLFLPTIVRTQTSRGPPARS